MTNIYDSAIRSTDGLVVGQVVVEASAVAAWNAEHAVYTAYKKRQRYVYAEMEKLVASVRHDQSLQESRAREDLAAALHKLADVVNASVTQRCTYPACKCIVSTSTTAPEPMCPQGLER